MQNLISIALTDQNLADIDADIASLEQKLSFLLDLTPQQRRKLNKMGDKSEAFARQTAVVAGQNTHNLPGSFDLAELQADIAALDKLRPRFTRIAQLAEKASDTELALGSDIMAGSLEGYAILKVAGKGAGLDALRQQMAARFNRTAKPATPAAPVPA